ncbi:S-adenosyl-L-methionine-dependent methyltransferase [Cokeromyces recurvatus]|uniref:S-adenosyl-L-methionine-dependent methyltransferase n=1 Tax=Cokeromyces recurvatus TaxID=90255 RepID=UPI00221E6BD8|nr:S-adenosyl-L-methionine-dependent methyltransferase [Cokeromyces recurvatus]KAI7905352.1 S-adenosyl-L-methionine-dependent methyltransferase [Cokeromyces recurvatus]
MANVDQINFVLHDLFIQSVKELLQKKYYSTSPSKVVKILEVGCGSGDFALILKNKLKDKVEITAIDPSDKINLAKSKSTGSDVHFEESDIFTYKIKEKFDLVLFTKSLHHCNPVEKAVQIAYDLLNHDGVFIAEEIKPDMVNDNDLIWFFNRLDLLRIAGRMISVEEKLNTAGHSKKMLTSMLNPSLPLDQRWFRSRGQNHHHDEKPLHRDDPEGIAHSHDVLSAISNQFGPDNISITPVPYFYQLISFAGLKNDEACPAILKELLKQEQDAINSSFVQPLGVNIVAYKKDFTTTS